MSRYVFDNIYSKISYFLCKKNSYKKKGGGGGEDYEFVTVYKKTQIKIWNKRNVKIKYKIKKTYAIL